METENARGIDLETRRRPLDRLASCIAHEATASDMRNIRIWGAWMLAWAAVSIPEAAWFGGAKGETSTVTLSLGVLKLVAVVGLVVTFSRFVRESDELNRMLHLRGVAIGFAAGFLATMAAEAAQQAGLVAAIEVDVIALVMILAYGISTAILTARMR